MIKRWKHGVGKQPVVPVEPPCPAAGRIGSKGNDPDDHQFGLRVETDRSWTVYHVFSGIPERTGGDVMSGLDRREATSRMLSLNRHVVFRSGMRAWVKPPAMDPAAGPRK